MKYLNGHLKTIKSKISNDRNVWNMDLFTWWSKDLNTEIIVVKKMPEPLKPLLLL